MINLYTVYLVIFLMNFISYILLEKQRSIGEKVRERMIVMIIVALSHLISHLMREEMHMLQLTIYFYLARDVAYILGLANKYGVPLPKVLKSLLYAPESEKNTSKNKTD